MSDRDAIFELITTKGNLVIEHRRYKTVMYIRDFPEHKDISMPYASNGSRRYDTAEPVRNWLRYWGRM